MTLPSGAGRGRGGFAPPSGGEGPPSGAGAGGPGGPPGGVGASGGSGSAGFAGGNSKFAAALRACGGGGFAGRGAPTGSTGLSLSSARERAAITTYARCMDSHGVKLPKPNFSGSGSVFGTRVKRSSKTFISANRICQADLRASSANPGG